MKTLILGGARSGKSRYAERLASRSGQESIFYIATGWAGDEEMRERIAHHQQQRPEHWQTLEEPIHLAKTFQQYNSEKHLLLVDCLTLWVSNCLAENCYQQQLDALLKILPEMRSEIILVSNEVGSGIVPLGNLSREFVDASGRLHQSFAVLCDSVTLVVAGLPLHLKPQQEKT